ncbi:unnamed protein product [Phytophthora fragariaefolia]|uniref:Unnamed protein product n=1 Tax=Phytophthora fragariaefolia TaxID=1490495 RepID=A0A9W7D4T0_9STRA|nr:unnamed protein product [Phytophthora fragariaefolia]
MCSKPFESSLARSLSDMKSTPSAATDWLPLRAILAAVSPMARESAMDMCGYENDDRNERGRGNEGVKGGDGTAHFEGPAQFQSRAVENMIAIARLSRLSITIIDYCEEIPIGNHNRKIAAEPMPSAIMPFRQPKS